MENKVRIRILDALRFGTRQLINPFSVNGSADLFRLFVAAGGPTFHQMAKKMGEHPEGARLMRERPDIGVVDDLDYLSRFPSGTLGHAHYTFMNIPGVYPGWLLAAQTNRDNYFNRVAKDWDPDAVWLFERLLNTHDITHTLGGYNASLAGEALTGVFTIAALKHIHPLASFTAKAAVQAISLLPATVGHERWKAALQDAAARGTSIADHIPFLCIPWEELLDKPMSALTDAIGYRPRQEQDAKIDDWLTGPIYKQFSTGFGTLPKDAPWLLSMVKVIQETGIPAKDLWGVSDVKRKHVIQLYDRGATPDKLRAAMAA